MPNVVTSKALRPCAHRTLDEGTQRHNGEEFAELLETEGAGFGVDLSLSGLQVVLDVPASHLERALELFAEAVIEPSLADRDVNRHVQLRLAEIEQAQANSAQTASIAFRAAVFDETTRAARMSGGEPDTVRQVTPDAVTAFHHDHFGPSGATLVLAGDFAEDPIAVAERCLGSWQNEDQRQVSIQEPTPGRRRTLLVDRPGAVQADVRFGSFGIDRLDPRWSAISVASYAMGGAFLSRLNAVLREEKGYTYGVRMNFGPLRTGGSFAVQGSFRTEVLVDALASDPGVDQGRRAHRSPARRSTTRSPSSPAFPRCGTQPPMEWLIKPRLRCSRGCLTITSIGAWRCCVR